MRAEALARAGDFPKATALAEGVVASDNSEPFARYTFAHVAHFSEAAPQALERIQAAIAAQRGTPAYLLEFLHHYNQGALDAAESALDSILKVDDRDSEALYNLALIHHKRDDYQGAREGYLRVLSVVPEHASARYNLGILTHSVGALDEAKHNLTKLTAIVGSEDERVKNLKAVIEGPPAPPEKRFVFDRANKH
jgi:tetratricopeptide (TPR) repeat protein